jgi:hypothetical protein
MTALWFINLFASAKLDQPQSSATEGGAYGPYTTFCRPAVRTFTVEFDNKRVLQSSHVHLDWLKRDDHNQMRNCSRGIFVMTGACGTPVLALPLLIHVRDCDQHLTPADPV